MNTNIQSRVTLWFVEAIVALKRAYLQVSSVSSANYHLKIAP